MINYDMISTGYRQPSERTHNDRPGELVGAAYRRLALRLNFTTFVSHTAFSI